MRARQSPILADRLAGEAAVAGGVKVRGTAAELLQMCAADGLGGVEALIIRSRGGLPLVGAADIQTGTAVQQRLG